MTSRAERNLPRFPIGLVLLVVLTGAFALLRALEERRDAREYALDAARIAGIFDERASDVWVRAAADSTRSDGVVTFRVPATAFEELGARAAGELGAAVEALAPEDRERLELLARRFRLPAELDPFDGRELAIHVGGLVFPGWRDYALLSRERGRVWFLRAVEAR